MEQVKSFDEIEDIECPHCGENQSFESCDQTDLTTYWGEELCDFECNECGKKFYVQEFVSRRWHVAKDYNDI